MIKSIVYKLQLFLHGNSDTVSQSDAFKVASECTSVSDILYELARIMANVYYKDEFC